MAELIEDTLGWNEDPDIKEQIHDEQIVFSGTCSKKNHFGMKQTRNLVITDKSLYNFEGKSKHIIYNTSNRNEKRVQHR